MEFTTHAIHNGWEQDGTAWLYTVWYCVAWSVVFIYIPQAPAFWPYAGGAGLFFAAGGKQRKEGMK